MYKFPRKYVTFAQLAIQSAHLIGATAFSHKIRCTPDVLRSLAILTLVTMLLLDAGRSVFVFIAFKINQDYIKKTLCENKNKPQVACDGKCYLSKQLKAAQDPASSETAALPHLNDLQSIQYCPTHLSIILGNQHLGIVAATLVPRSERFRPQDVYASIFRPPWLAA